MDNISLFDIEDTGISNYEIVPLILERLEKKYNKKFYIKCIGERYGTDKFDEVTAYCSPIEDEKFVFTVRFDMINEQIIEDDYYIRNNCYELEKNIEKILEENEIELINKVEIFGKNQIDEDMTVNEFSEKYTNANYISIIVINNEKFNGDLEKGFEYVRDKYNKIYLKTIIYIVDGKDYEILSQESKIVPYFSTTTIEKYNIKEQHNISIHQGRVIKIK